MIAISLLFFIAGVVLLAAGLVAESIQLELGAVVCALVSALALYLGVRSRSSEPDQRSEPSEPWRAPLRAPSGPVEPDEVWTPPPPDEPWPTEGDDAESSDSEIAPADGAGAGDQDQTGVADEPDLTDAAPLDDEPAEEEVSAANVARVAARSDDVLVVDGRPRYHRRACSSLIGRETVPLPVSEAREAGFTPCARCRPDAHLLGSLERQPRR